MQIDFPLLLLIFTKNKSEMTAKRKALFRRK